MCAMPAAEQWRRAPSGPGAIVQPWVWSGAMAKAVSGRLAAALLAITAIGALIPLVGNTPFLLAISAIIFGNAFFAVTSSATAFARLNYLPSAWPHSIARITLSFGQRCWSPGPLL